MPSAIEAWMGDDDLSRQRRKRDARLLDGEVPDFPGLTVADVVADVLAASDEGHSTLDVPSYLVERGHTIDDDQDGRRLPATPAAGPSSHRARWASRAP